MSVWTNTIKRSCSFGNYFLHFLVQLQDLSRTSEVEPQNFHETKWPSFVYIITSLWLVVSYRRGLLFAPLIDWNLLDINVWTALAYFNYMKIHLCAAQE